jgi:hypothetical protein
VGEKSRSRETQSHASLPLHHTPNILHASTVQVLYHQHHCTLHSAPNQRPLSRETGCISCISLSPPPKVTSIIYLAPQNASTHFYPNRDLAFTNCGPPNTESSPHTHHNQAHCYPPSTPICSNITTTASLPHYFTTRPHLQLPDLCLVVCYFTREQLKIRVHVDVHEYIQPRWYIGEDPVEDSCQFRRYPFTSADAASKSISMADVLPVQVSDGQPYYTSSSIRRSPPSQTSLFIGTPPYSPRKSKYVAPEASADSFSESSSSSSSSRTSQVDLTKASSFASTVSSSLTLDTSYDLDEDINFPTYGGGGYMNPYEDDEPPSPRTDNSYTAPSPTTDSTPTHTPDNHIVAEDDTAIKQVPSRHVDYLSHEWREEDIWSSWRHIVSKRRLYGERSRLENASWRTWAKQKNRLRTIPPDTLNWYVLPFNVAQCPCH